MALLEGVVLAVILTCLLLIIRLFTVVKTGSNYKPGAKGPVSVVVVAGSGGHTTEVLRLMECLSAAYTPRHYVIADSDRMSEEKICTFERSRQHSDSESQFTICWIPRSREVHQSWSSSVISTLNALLYSLPLMFRLRPDMPPGSTGGALVGLFSEGLPPSLFGRTTNKYIKGFKECVSKSKKTKECYFSVDRLRPKLSGSG
uniref:UDP-N-acetylglucosamine transferase subunit ALG14 homolog n=1 Tax=Epinephelus lanceolatus TaxID=310571 RepID=UPI00144817CD|nr:UDP-N-acetylglucosamine transferase subunit ALG14 homolog [Epinephelus lanceolatus]